MEIEPIGILTIALGAIGSVWGRPFIIYVFINSILVGSSAAILLPVLGNANIQPAHLLLGFVALSATFNRAWWRSIAGTLKFSNEGFWLIITAIYAVLGAIFLPRIFADMTYVFAVARTQADTGIIEIPLSPTSGNITQSIYFLGSFLCFLIFYNHAAKPSGLTTIVGALLTAAAFNLVFALIDLAGYWSGFGDPLAVFRNANYAMLVEGSELGFKRIVGSFPEASTFAYFTVGFFAFCTKLWLSGIRTRLSGPLALMSLCALIFATSSTGYAATLGFLVTLFLVNLGAILTRPVSRSVMVLVTVMPLLLAGGLTGLRLYQPGWAVLEQMVDDAVLHKLSSSSGIERTRWNEQALRNFVDTQGFGAGVGSVRASSFPIAVLATIGWFGATTYAIFLLQLFFGRKNRWRATFPAASQSAARWACFAQLIAATVSGGFIDFGLPFFIFAGVACARPETARAPLAAPTVNPLEVTAA